MTYSPIPTIYNLFYILIQKKVVENITDIWKKNNLIAHWVSKSAFSFSIISELSSKINKKKINVWVPSYFCNQSLIYLRKTNCNLIFYNVNDDFSIDFENCKKNILNGCLPDIFIAVHYFGKPSLSSKITDFCRQYNCWLIEDCVHCIAPDKGIGDYGDFILYSPHKNFGIPNGSICIVNKDGPNKFTLEFIQDNFNSKRWKSYLIILSANFKRDLFTKFKQSNLIWIIKKLIQNIGIVRKTNIYTEDILRTKLNNYESPYISNLSKYLLNIYVNNILEYKEIRKRNYILLNNIFNNSNITLEHNPYLYRLNIPTESIEFYYNLNKHKFLYLTTWPDLPEEILTNQEKYKTTIQLRTYNLFLPLHQNIKLNDFYNINKVYNNNFLNKNYEVTYNKTNYNNYEWNKLVDSNLMQSWEYGEAKSKIEGWNTYRYNFYLNNNIIAITQVLKKKYLFFFTLIRINRGPVLLEKVPISVMLDLYNLILNFGTIYKLKFLFISPNINILDNNFNINFFNYNLEIDKFGYTSSIIDLNRSLNEIRNSFTSKWRNMLNTSQKSGLTYNIISNNIDFEWFCKLYLSSMNKKKLL